MAPTLAPSLLLDVIVTFKGYINFIPSLVLLSKPQRSLFPTPLLHQFLKMAAPKEKTIRDLNGTWAMVI